MNIDQFMANLRSKYNYSESMIKFLKELIPALIIYYGADKTNIILSTLNECEIHIQQKNENTNEYLNNYFASPHDFHMPFLGGAFTYTDLIINNNKIVPKSIIYIPTMILDTFYKSFEFDDVKKISLLVHEICHAIKQYGHIKEERGQIVIACGLCKDYYQYDSSNHSFNTIKSINIGIEEALNAYDELEIMKILFGNNIVNGSAYENLRIIASKLMQYPELANAIRNSQFNGDSEWMKVFGKKDSEYLIEQFDIYYNTLVNIEDIIYNPEKGNEAWERLNKYVQTNLVDLMNYSENKDKRY